MKKSPEERRANAKAARLWKLFRLRPEEQDEIEAFQRNDAIYNVLLGEVMGTDHDHFSGLVRGRLDFRINRALGMLENSFKERTPKVLRALATYLEHPPAVIALGKKVWGLLGKAQVKKKMVYGPPKEQKGKNG